jgi:hypothetical protein
VTNSLFFYYDVFFQLLDQRNKTEINILIRMNLFLYLVNKYSFRINQFYSLTQVNHYGERKRPYTVVDDELSGRNRQTYDRKSPVWYGPYYGRNTPCRIPRKTNIVCIEIYAVTRPYSKEHGSINRRLRSYFDVTHRLNSQILLDLF